MMHIGEDLNAVNAATVFTLNMEYVQLSEKNNSQSVHEAKYQCFKFRTASKKTMCRYVGSTRMNKTAKRILC